jgi:hypothetical protein
MTAPRGTQAMPSARGSASGSKSARLAEDHCPDAQGAPSWRVPGGLDFYLRLCRFQFGADAQPDYRSSGGVNRAVVCPAEHGARFRDGRNPENQAIQHREKIKRERITHYESIFRQP